MTSRVALAAIVAAISVVACGVTPPTTTPSATRQAIATPIAGSPAPAPTQSPEVVIVSTTTPISPATPSRCRWATPGLDWAPPLDAPVMPNGRPAARVAFLPASCAPATSRSRRIRRRRTPGRPRSSRTATSTPTPRQPGPPPRCRMREWPGADVPGRRRTTRWHRPAPSTWSPRARTPTSTLSAVEVVPVYTSADATQPALTTTGDIEFGPIPGPEKPRGKTAQPLATIDFGRATLPTGRSRRGGTTC